MSIISCSSTYQEHENSVFYESTEQFGLLWFGSIQSCMICGKKEIEYICYYFDKILQLRYDAELVRMNIFE